jgi:CRP-like cAMP-binding protein
MTSPEAWKPRSCLLDRLPGDVCTRLAPHLQLVELPVGKVLMESGPGNASPCSHAYFLRSGIVSLMYATDNGDTGEIVTLGHEGLLGVALLTGRSSMTTRAVVQSPGEAFALRADVMEQEFRRGGPFQTMVLRHTQWLMAQMAQAAICNRHHSIEKQVCRWLLLAFTRLGARDQLRITHESLANLLGVRREGITEAAGRLQEAGAISYARGSIRLEDRASLERRACECFGLLYRDYMALCAAVPFE